MITIEYTFDGIMGNNITGETRNDCVRLIEEKAIKKGVQTYTYRYKGRDWVKSVQPFVIALRTFQKTLKRDKELFYTYQCNIAMAFVDESRRQGSRDSYKRVHSVANQAAINFLNLLIKK